MATDTFLVLEDASVYAGTGIGALAPEAGRLVLDSDTGGQWESRAPEAGCDAVFGPFESGLQETARVETGPLPAGTGELVFNTGMTGYHEIITDPSYTGQLVIMTSPHIGNYGDLEEWSETEGCSGAGGLIMRAAYRGPAPQGRMSLDGFLKKRGIPGISGIDTRALTLRIRKEGNLKGCIVRSSGGEGEAGAAAMSAGSAGADRTCSEAGTAAGVTAAGGTALTRKEIDICVRHLEGCPDMEGLDLVSFVGGRAANQDADPAQAVVSFQTAGSGQKDSGGLHFAVVDFGIKQNILRELRKRGCRVTILPHTVSAKEIRSVGPDAVLLSNGPGDPAVLTEEIRMIRGIAGEYPLFGICLGHQLISLALGAATYKLKFGHHSLNQPVIDTGSGKVFITSQNHGFAVREPEENEGARTARTGQNASRKDMLDTRMGGGTTIVRDKAPAGTWPDGLNVWMRNANDGTIEGIRHDRLRIRAVQFHPEAAPGPRDTLWIFDEFITCALGRS